MFACTLFGVDRQVYYRKITRRKTRQSSASKVVSLVLEIRQAMPRIGAKKLYFLLNNELKGLKIGRDKFINILRANHLLIVPKRSYHITTNSHHRFRKHQNQILELQIQRPEQVWVSDITYIGKRENPYYLSLVTDAYSKKIVGFNVADNMNTESSMVALKNAVKNRKYTSLSLIHHSDRGLQYCANDYQKILNKSNIKCNMTQNSDPYENAVAERINGILKQEFAVDKFNAALPVMKFLVKNAIQIYNEKRPHYSNYMLTPNQMHQQNKIIMRTYKTKNTCKNVLASV
jgi:transposase InsO family protein